MADRDATWDLVAVDKSGPGTRSAIRNADKLKRANKDAADSYGKVSKDASKAGGLFTSLFGDLAKQGQKSGLLAGNAAIDSFGSAFKALPPEVQIGLAASLAGAATLAAPGIVAAVNAAVLAGLGAGGLAVGIALAAKDPRVAAAFSNLSRDVTSRLDKSVEPFKDQLVGAAGIFGKSFENVAPRIDRIFAGLSTTIQPLARGLGKALENAFPGLEKALQASLPLLRIFAAELPRLGKVAGELFSAIAAAGPGAAFAFKVILVSVEALIKSLQWLIDSLGPVANGVNAIAQAAGNLKAKLTGNEVQAYGVALNTTGQSARTAGSSFDALSRSTYNTAQAADQANAAFDRLFGEMMNVDQANLAVKAGMASLTSTIKGNAKTLDENTESGRQNVGAILGQISALDQKRQADIAAGNGTKTATDKANSAYASQVQSLRNVLVQMGLTESEVDSLIAKYQQIPRNINTTITTTHVNQYRDDGRSLEGNSRYGNQDFSGLDGWRPAEFAAATQFAGSGGGGNGRTIAPYQVTNNNDVSASIFIDGAPVRVIAKQVSTEETKRQAWKNRGRR